MSASIHASQQDLEALLTCAAVAFDVDDTLVQTFNVGFQKINCTAIALGQCEITLEDFAAIYGKLEFSECLKRWFPDIPVRRSEGFYSRATALNPPRPIGAFGELREDLRRRGIKVGIVTNGPSQKTGVKLRCVGVAALELLDFSICGDSGVARKPSPEGLQTVAQSLGLSPNQILFVGDSEQDRSAALAAGCCFIAVNTGPFDWSLLDRNAPHWVDSINSIGEVLAPLVSHPGRDFLV